MSNPRSVVADTVFTLLVSPPDGTTPGDPRGWQNASLPVPVGLRYDACDAFAVHLRFTTGPTRDVRWVFARALLTDGLLGVCGAGDVRVWPCADPCRDVVYVELTSPSGYACFEASATVIADFLDRSFALVAPGTESDQMDLDAVLEGLLTTDEH